MRKEGAEEKIDITRKNVDERRRERGKRKGCGGAEGETRGIHYVCYPLLWGSSGGERRWRHLSPADKG